MSYVAEAVGRELCANRRADINGMGWQSAEVEYYHLPFTLFFESSANEVRAVENLRTYIMLRSTEMGLRDADERSMIPPLQFEAFVLALIVDYCTDSKVNWLAVSSRSWEYSLSSSRPWNVCIESDGHAELQRYQLSSSSILLRLTLEDSTLVYIIGNSFDELCKIAFNFACPSQQELPTFLFSVKQLPFVSDCFSTKPQKVCCHHCVAGDEFSKTQFWNISSNSVQVVRKGNSADALHHLEHISHNAALFRSVSDAANSFPQVWTGASICINDNEGHAIVQQVLPFIFQSDGKVHIILSIEQCSPVYNYACETECHFTVVFVDADKPEEKCNWFCGDELRFDETCALFVPVFAKSCLPATTLSSYRIGDCCIVLGRMRESDFPLHSAKTQPYIPKSVLFPVLCVAIHNVFGRVGIVSNGCILASHFPPSIAIFFPKKDAFFGEKDINPNITVHFFSKSSNAFAEVSRNEGLDLPFPISTLESNRNHFGCVMKGNIIRMEEGSDLVIVVICITYVKKEADLFFRIVD